MSVFEIQRKVERGSGMKCYFKRVTVALLVLALLLTMPLLGCAKEVEEKVTITIGTITDLTGPAGPALVSLTWALEDLVKHINEEDPIPGVELRTLAYDCRMDPARDIPGYDWLRERGAKVIITPLEYTAIVVKPFAKRDQIPVFSLSASQPLVESPGWAFCLNTFARWETLTVLEWVSDHWDYVNDGIPKIGCIAPSVSAGIECEEAVKDHCQANPDKFEWVGSSLVPMGTVSWASEVAKLKGCDWLGLPLLDAVSMSTFIEQFRAQGYTAKIFTQEALPAFRGFVVDKVGYEDIDGSLAAIATGWWNDPYPVVDLLEDLLYRYHADEAEDTIYSGIGYIGGGIQQYFILQILRQAIEEVGAKDFDGQALYDTVTEFKMVIQGFEEWGFSDTKRLCLDHVKIYEVSAEAEDLVAISDWIPMVED